MSKIGERHILRSIKNSFWSNRRQFYSGVSYGWSTRRITPAVGACPGCVMSEGMAIKASGDTQQQQFFHASEEDTWSNVPGCQST